MTFFLAGLCMFAGPAIAKDQTSNSTTQSADRGTEDLAQTDKYYWVAPKASMRLCPKPQADIMNQIQCPELKSGRFFITHVVMMNKVPVFYRIVTDDNQIGFVRVEDKVSFVDQDPQVAKNTSKADCQKFGEPKIGMTVEQAENTCWGKPLKINRVKAHSRVREQRRYQKDRSLYFENGILVAIETLR